MMLLAFGLAALTFSGHVQFWHVVVFAALLGTAASFDMPARQAFTVELVGKDDLLNAVALNATAFNIARLIGPAISGVIVGAVGEAWAFSFNGVSFFAVLAGLLLMHMPRVERPAAARSPLMDVKEGWGYILRARPIQMLFISIIVPSVLGYNYLTLIPIFAGDILGAGPAGFGIMLSAVGGGALTAGLFMATLGHRFRRGRMQTAGAFIFAFAQVGFALSHTMPLALLFLYLSGLATLTQLVNTNTLLQTNVADGLRGRVMGTYMWVLIGLSPPGALLVGAVAEAWGAPTAILGCSAVGLAAASLILWRAPVVWRLE
jgi:MFS family permease